MIPQTGDDLRQDFEFETLPSRTFRMNHNSLTIIGTIDQIQAVEQAVYLILNTERYEWLIHSWNYGVELTITSNGETGKYTRMCVPNMMMFNGEDEGKAELVALAEAEYTYANTSVEGNPQNVEWTNAIMAIFDENPYAYYAPLPDEVEATEEESSGESSAPSAPAADAGGC